MSAFLTRSHAHDARKAGVRVLSDGRCIRCGRFPEATVAETWHRQAAA